MLRRCLLVVFSALMLSVIPACSEDKPSANPVPRNPNANGKDAPAPNLPKPKSI
jgi:hypothetical protein